MSKLKKISKAGLKITIFIVIFFIVHNVNVYAQLEADTQALDNIVDWLAAWVGRVGLLVAFFGGVQLSLGFRNDDPDAKVRGLKTLVSGFMVYGISKSLDLFGL